MGNYRNFELATYFVAHATKRISKDELQQQIDFFKKYMKLDKVYLEAFRGGDFASCEQVEMVKTTLEENGIKVEGGITTTLPDAEGAPRKQRLFDVVCYNDEDMLSKVAKASEQNARFFDRFIIDDFYFTNCTCDKCRKGRDEYNKAHNITDGSWQAYRVNLMYEASLKYMIAPAKEVNPNCKITIKFPNWMESYQETGYDPMSEKDIFDDIYTGTETRDPAHQDQHLPRYLSFSLMRYMESLAPHRNGGGWFDPFDCQVLDYYLEQAYLTAFSKPKELMMFCFQALYNQVITPSLGFMLEKLDDVLDNLGNVIGVPCYIPNASQGEDNIQDYLGMCGFPIVTTPFFEEDAPIMMLTKSSAYDKDIVDKLEAYLVKGGKAIVTNGFVEATMERGIKRITSIRNMSRKISTNKFMGEQIMHRYGWENSYSSKELSFPVVEFRNNATWAALCKASKAEESYTLLARDTYGKGEMITLVVPDSFSDFKWLPAPILTRMREEFKINDMYLEGGPDVSLFAYDNDTIVLYSYVSSEAYDKDVFLHINGAKKLKHTGWGFEMDPLYVEKDEAVFKIRARVGKFDCIKIIR